ncbi:universal stress protein [Amylibacter sp. SFDW26]|uniref:universal stress protein n=1 Tax=Amylibacter sp. SFDW26 TaxID=2652722 RepID=UPI00126156C9|nr:universal stress protein [Amylibacter sp. SFDW26]KAB7613777.1 universal stress protein [Amylibacter sp. SFDW26]
MSNAILCAVDISNPGADAKVINTAAELARLHDAQLDVVTVVPDFGMSVVGSFFNQDHHDKAMSEAKKQLNIEVSKVIGDQENAKVRHIISTGNAYDEVLKVAKEANTTLIVVGAHKPDFKDYLLGPNAARIVRHSKCSVYVVR